MNQIPITYIVDPLANIFTCVMDITSLLGFDRFLCNYLQNLTKEEDSALHSLQNLTDKISIEGDGLGK